MDEKHPEIRSEEETRALAAQLRKPTGQHGNEVAEFMNKGNRGINLHALAVLDASDNDRILEIGMGNGHFTSRIVKGNANIKYRGLDYSPDMVDLSKELQNHLVSTHNVDYLCGDASSLPFEPAEFNKIFTVNTMYFWEDLRSTMQELHRVLEDGGCAVLAVRPAELLRRMPITKYDFIIREDTEIREEILKAGFQKVRAVDVVEEPQMVFGQSISLSSVIYSALI